LHNVRILDEGDWLQQAKTSRTYQRLGLVNLFDKPCPAFAEASAGKPAEAFTEASAGKPGFS